MLTVGWLDFPPNTNTAMHFTDTLDHVVIAAGKLELVLTDGSKRTCVSGDYIVQLGGFHQWNNVTDEWARKLLCVSCCIQNSTFMVCRVSPRADFGCRVHLRVSTVEASLG